MNDDNIQLSAVEDHDGILTIRGGGARRDWNGIHYKQGDNIIPYDRNQPSGG